MSSSGFYRELAARSIGLSAASRARRRLPGTSPGVGRIHGPLTIGAPLRRLGPTCRASLVGYQDSRAAQAAETPKRIVAAAREVFTELGYEAATFQAIAVRADQTLSARHGHPDATERPYFALMFRAGRRIHGRWQCPRCSTCRARGRRSIRRPRCVNLEDATGQEVVSVVVGQDVLRGNLRRCIAATSDSERHAASMTRRCRSGKSPKEPASSMWSGADAIVDVGAGAAVWFGSGLLDGGGGGAVSGGGGGARWTRRCSTTRRGCRLGHDHPARRVLVSASRPLPAQEFAIHESDGARDEKERRPKHNHRVTKLHDGAVNVASASGESFPA